MSTQEYCGRHSIHYMGRSCPRCDAEERHKELLSATEESVADTVDAMREADYRRANPGDYACPHCKYISLKRGASRCPLCQGEVESDYWSAIQAAEKAAARAAVEQKAAAAAAAAAAWERSAPERAAAAERTALAAANAAAEARRRRRLRTRLVVLSSCLVTGLFVASLIRMYYVQRRPLAPEIVGVTPAQFSVDYWFCFDAEGAVRIEPSGVLSSMAGIVSGSPAMHTYGEDSTRGYFNSDLVYPLFSQRISVVSVEPKPVRFRIWEPPRERSNMYFGCGGR